MIRRHLGLVSAALLAALAIGGVVAVAGLAGDGASGGVASPAAQEATPSPTPTPTSTGTATDEVVAIEDLRVTSYEVFLSRDPFEPVVPVLSGGADDGSGTPMPAPTVAPTSSPTTAPTVSPTTSPTTSPSPAPGGTASPSPDGCVDGGTVVCGGQTVALVDVYDDGEPGAVVRVDGTIYEVRTGEVFAGNFEVRSIESPCATLLYGDDAFTLCEGESTLK